MENLADLKAQNIISELLMEFVQATSPQYFLGIMAETIKESKKNKSVIEMLKMAGSIVDVFSVPSAPKKAIAVIAGPNITNPVSASKPLPATLAVKTGKRARIDKLRFILEV